MDTIILVVGYFTVTYTFVAYAVALTKYRKLFNTLSWSMKVLVVLAAPFLLPASLMGKLVETKEWIEFKLK
jgi:hypothetical protein